MPDVAISRMSEVVRKERHHPGPQANGSARRTVPSRLGFLVEQKAVEASLLGSASKRRLEAASDVEQIAK